MRVSARSRETLQRIRATVNGPGSPRRDALAPRAHAPAQRAMRTTRLTLGPPAIATVIVPRIERLRRRLSVRTTRGLSLSVTVAVERTVVVALARVRCRSRSRVAVAADTTSLARTVHGLAQVTAIAIRPRRPLAGIRTLGRAGATGGAAAGGVAAGRAGGGAGAGREPGTVPNTSSWPTLTSNEPSHSNVGQVSSCGSSGAILTKRTLRPLSPSGAIRFKRRTSPGPNVPRPSPVNGRNVRPSSETSSPYSPNAAL